MKYKIIVEKINDHSYRAHWSLSEHFSAYGKDLDSSLSKLQEQMLCYLHDPQARWEIVVNSQGQKGTSRIEERYNNIGKNIILTLFVSLLLAGTVYAERLNSKISDSDIKKEAKNIKSSKQDIKLKAIKELGLMRDSRASKELVNAMKNEKNKVAKARIIEALAKTGGKDSAKDVEDVLKNETDVNVKLSAAYTLAFVRDPEVVPTLINTFLNEDEDLGVRLQSASALSRYPYSEDIYSAFSQGLESENPQVRAQSITSMSIFAGRRQKKAVDAIRTMLKDEDEWVQKMAKERLIYLGLEKEDEQN